MVEIRVEFGVKRKGVARIIRRNGVGIKDVLFKVPEDLKAASESVQDDICRAGWRCAKSGLLPHPITRIPNVSNRKGVQMEQGISSASINSGFFTTMGKSGDVKAVLVGHDHLNDFCGSIDNINLSYSGGFGYHAYGQAGWSR